MLTHSLHRAMTGALAALLALICSAAETPARTAYVNFSFDQVDIRTFVKLVGEITAQTFVVDQGVDGKVTIVTPPIPVDQVFPLFVSVLESAGCSVVQEKGVTRVVALSTRESPNAPVVGEGDALPTSGLVTKVMHLKYVRAADLRKMLEPRVGGGKAGAVHAVEGTNHLIVTDTVDNIRKIEKIIAELDKSGLSRVTEVVPLQYASAEEIAHQIGLALMGGETAAEQLARRLPKISEGGGESRNVVIVPAPHSNSLVLVGTPEEVAEAKELIAKMDVDSPSGRGRLHAIFLQYIGAEEAAKSLNALLDKAPDKKADPAAPQQSAVRKVAIEASAANNALLVDATPRDFELIQELVGRMDRLPEQVLIEVLIAEVSLTDQLDVGVEMAALDMPSKVGDSVIQGSSKVEDGTALMNAVQSGLFPRGITIGVAHGVGTDSSGKIITGFPGVLSINAVKKNSKFRIRSRIPLLAQNNKEATVSVVNNIPLLKSTIQGGSGTSRDVIQNIDRMDVGIKLKLTPHINPNKEVQMVLNPSIEAIVDPGSSSTSFTPTIARREVSTTVIVPNGNTIVLSGLIREDQTKVVTKIPVLGSIPVLGVLFRHTVDGRERTDLTNGPGRTTGLK